MKRLIIAGLMLAAAIACSKQNPESTYLVDPGKADPVADFEYEIDREAGIVHFKNTSTGAIAYRWEFGDAAGSSSIEENPSFTYTASGTYTVSLKASNGYVSSLKTVTLDYELPEDVLIMSIDGNIDDWEKIPYRDDVDVWGAVTAIKTATTGSNLYVLIEGIYTTSGGTTMVVSYKVYLGKNNYADFNVFRNCHHTYTVTIRTCNDYDTRVDYDVLTNANITPAFNNPLDAHCNAVRCFGFTANRDGWILYVEEPDKHPWLEISFSPQYRPRIAGKTYYDADGQPLDEQMIAATRFEGTGSPLTKYFYIHTDEYIPANGNADESWNNTTDENAWRIGYVVLYDKGNKSSYRLEVKQRPAQVVKMPIKNLLGQTTGYNEYYVEYELEQKNLTWGFLKYGANPVMTGMINDRWDGLSNTRKLYQEAIKAGDVTEAPDDADGKIYRGAYNGYYTIEDDYPWQKDDVAAVINQIPDDHMIKYVLSKNRDRNGNGYIDYDEIVWYVPALDELAELRRVLDAGHMAFQNSEDRFHSSTPYLAGYTDEVPGRAFYVKMGDGETAFAMRDRQYNVICCRRKGAWLGNPDAGYEGGVTVDDTWDEEGEENIIMPKGN